MSDPLPRFPPTMFSQFRALGEEGVGPCPKCGNDNEDIFDVKYVPPRYEADEHLRVVCGQCLYFRLYRTVDADD